MHLPAHEQRFHHLDALRASALILGILLHAIFAYMPGHREANYPLSDNSTSSELGIVYFVIHLFRMSLFLVIAGFFARLLHQRLGSWRLIKNPLRRIALPLIAFLVVTMPLVVIAIIWGARQFGITAPSKFEFPFPIIGPDTEDTLFRIGSISKGFVELACKRD